MTTPTSARAVLDEDLDLICAAADDVLADLDGTNVLMTGGAGFLGYELVQGILRWNRAGAATPVTVTVLDNFSRGVPDWLTDAAEADDQLRLVKGDVRAPLPDEVERPDHIIHAASIASPTYYRMHPIETMDANVQGLRRLLDHARERAEAGDPVTSFLNFSTSEIYGDPPADMIPTPETYRGNVSCTGPRACYDESKRYGETLAVEFARVHDVPVRTVRPFNNYGPGLKLSDGRAMPDFARDVLAGDDVVLLSDGSPTRTYCYVADAVVGYLRVLLRGRDGEAYNIGTAEPETSMLELARLVANEAADLFGYAGEVVHEESDDPEYLTDNPQRRCPNIDKAAEELGYRPTMSLRDGVRRNLVWYADQTED